MLAGGVAAVASLLLLASPRRSSRFSFSDGSLGLCATGWMISFGLQRRFSFQGRLQRLLGGEQCRGKTIHPCQLLLQSFRASAVLGGQALGGTRRSHGRFQPRGDRRGFPFLLSQRCLEGFGLFPGSIDFSMRSIFHRPNMRRLDLTFGRYAAFVRVEGLGELLGTLLPPITLLQEFSQLASLLLHETLDVRQSRFGDLTGLIRALRQYLGSSQKTENKAR